MDCNQNLIPLIFFHDVNGFMVGRDAEWSGIIKAGAKMVNAVSNSVVPKITVIVGGSFGGRPLRHVRQSVRSEICFCLADGALRCNERRRGGIHSRRNQNPPTRTCGKVLSEEERKELFETTKRTYDEQTDPRYGAARLWIDRIIDPSRNPRRHHPGPRSRSSQS